MIKAPENKSLMLVMPRRAKAKKISKKEKKMSETKPEAQPSATPVINTPPLKLQDYLDRRQHLADKHARRAAMGPGQQGATSSAD